MPRCKSEEGVIDAQTQNLVAHQQTTNFGGKKRMKISIYTKRGVCVCVCVYMHITYNIRT